MKITVVGAGMVGSTTAYSLFNSKLVSEIALVDLNKDRATAEALDMSHAAAVDLSCKIYSADYSQTADSDIVIITAGVSFKPGQTRLDIIDINKKIIKDVVEEVVKYSPNCIIIMASNPLDAMTFAAYKYSGFDKSRIIGSGTVLDSARFRDSLSQKLNCNPTDILAYTLGEHGDSQIEMFSSVMVAGIPLKQYCKQCNINFTEEDKKEVSEATVQAAYKIKDGKGATYYGIATSLTRIVQAIVRDEDVILPVSVVLEGEYGFSDVCLAVPTKVNKKGAGQVLEIAMTQEEKAGLENSYQIVKGYCGKV